MGITGSAAGDYNQIQGSVVTTDVTGIAGTETQIISDSITPRSSSKRVLIIVSFDYGAVTNTADANVRIRRGTNQAGTVVGENLLREPDISAGIQRQYTWTFIDSPATSSAQAYELTFVRNSGTGTITVFQASISLVEID